jgi:hypothetical protein
MIDRDKRDRHLCDDSPWLQARGFWNDTGVSSHTNRSFHAHERAQLKATHALHGTTEERGSIFTPGPMPENPPKRYLVANVQQNYLSLLFERNTSGNVDPTRLKRRNAAFIPMLERHGHSAAQVGKSWHETGAHQSNAVSGSCLKKGIGRSKNYQNSDLSFPRHHALSSASPGMKPRKIW